VKKRTVRVKNGKKAQVISEARVELCQQRMSIRDNCRKSERISAAVG
jgi:hypothetical protein